MLLLKYKIFNKPTFFMLLLKYKIYLYPNEPLYTNDIYTTLYGYLVVTFTLLFMVTW
jgi:hypothetical protein